MEGLIGSNLVATATAGSKFSLPQHVLCPACNASAVSKTPCCATMGLKAVLWFVHYPATTLRPQRVYYSWLVFLMGLEVAKAHVSAVEANVGIIMRLPRWLDPK